MTSVKKLPIPKPLTTPPPGLTALIKKRKRSPSGSSSKTLSRSPFRSQRKHAWTDLDHKKTVVAEQVTNVVEIRKRVKTPKGEEYAKVVAEAAAAGRRSAVGGKRKTRKNK